MPSRTFTDERGVQWTVWAVDPMWADRRSGHQRRVMNLDEEERAEFERLGLDRRHEGDRRRGLGDSGPRVRISPNLAGGWLAFESRDERRRLSPIPERWEDASETELAALCARAGVAPLRRGRLIE